MPAGQLSPYNDATRSVIEQISGIRTPEQIIREFFGIEMADTINPQILREKNVWWNDKLAKLGLDEAKFISTIHTFCPRVPENTFEPPKESIPKKKKRLASE